MIDNIRSVEEIVEILLPPTKFSRPDDANTRELIASALRAERERYEMAEKELEEYRKLAFSSRCEEHPCLFHTDFAPGCMQCIYWNACQYTTIKMAANKLREALTKISMQTGTNDVWFLAIEALNAFNEAMKEKRLSRGK